LGGRFSGLTASLIQPFAGHYADIFGRKLVVIVGSIVTLASMGLFLLAALTRNWVILVAAYLLFGLSMLGSPASQAVIAESVDLDPTRMGIAFSAVFLLSSVTSTVTSLAGGVLADVLGYYLIFVIALLFESLDLFLYFSELRETRPSTDAAHAVTHGRKFSLRSAASLPKGLLGFFAAFAMDSFAFGITASIIVGMVYDRFRYSNTDIGLIVGVVSLATILAQYPATRLLLLVGPKKSLALSEFLGAVLMLGWYFANSIPFFILLSVIFGVSVATWVPAQQSITMTVSPPGERGSLGGKLAAFRGLVAFPAPIVGGVLYEVYGYQAPSLVSFVLVVLTLLMIIKFLPEQQAKV
jgi:DHA1 family multidrug resistance protein-like MFS transporter